MTIYERVGGYEKLEQIVAQFYQGILADDRINYFFLENVSDIPKLHSTMVQFLTGLFGGPNQYKGKCMKDLHVNMPIQQIHYDLTWFYLEEALKHFSIPQPLILEIRELIYSRTKHDIVNTPS